MDFKISKFLMYRKYFNITLYCALISLLSQAKAGCLSPNDNLPDSGQDFLSQCQTLNSQTILTKNNSLYFDKLKRQKAIIKKLEKYNKDDYKIILKKTSLQSLTENKLTLQSDSIADLENNPESAILKINLMEDKNLNIILKNTLINKLPLLENDNEKICVEDLIELLDESINNSDNDRCYNIQILKKLAFLEKLSNNNIDCKNFNCFLRGIKDAYQVSVSRDIANEILVNNREKIERIMGSMSSSTDISGSASYNLSGIKVGIAASFSKTEGADENSLYKIDKEGNIRIFLGPAVDSILKAEIGGNVGVVSSVVFYSLEQYLDSGEKSNMIEINNKNINEIVSSREKMQQNEKLLLSEFHDSIENYLKATSIIPDSIFVDWPSVTKVSPQYHVQAAKGGIDIAASLLSTAGLKISGTKEKITTIKSLKYLSLISDDCLPTDNLTSDDIQKFFAKKNKLKDGTCKDKILVTVQNLIQDKQNLLGIASLILGDLRQYNSTLSNTSENSKKSLKLKHDIQDRWLANKKLMSKKGRKDMLQAAIIVSSYLRELVTDNSQINLFKQIYQEIYRLSNMQAFSKNKKSQNSSFNSKHKVKSYSVDGKLSIDIPYVGNTSALITYSQIKGNKFESGEDMVIQIKLPMTNNSILGTEHIKKQLLKLANRLLEKENSILSQNLGRAFLIASDAFARELPSFNIPCVKLIKSPIDVDNYSLININLSKVNKSDKNIEILPLPQQNVIYKHKDIWALKSIKLSEALRIGSNISNTFKKSTSILGTDTLSHIISRYSVFKMGLQQDNQSENPLWIRFKAVNSESIKQLINNISCINSNSRYELQCMYNDITLTQNYNDKLEDNINKTFADLLIACENYRIDQSEENFKKSLSILEAVLNLYYNEYFIVEYNNLFSIQ